MSSESSLDRISAILREVGGYFVFGDASGEEFMVISKREYERRSGVATERQLELLADMPRQPKTADDMLEVINRDIALYQLQQVDESDSDAAEEEGITFISAGVEEDDLGLTMPSGGKTVRFESLRGDLPPELQE